MFGFGKRKAEKVKVDLIQVAELLGRRFWDYEMGTNNTIVVKGKYRNNRRDFHRLYLKFIGENVRFVDARGAIISEVPRNKLFPELKEIMNVL